VPICGIAAVVVFALDFIFIGTKASLGTAWLSSGALLALGLLLLTLHALGVGQIRNRPPQ
jgi:hypothetical protein